MVQLKWIRLRIRRSSSRISGVGAMQRQISAQKYIDMMADGEIQMSPGGAVFMTNVLTAVGLA
jgi:hypothetical protein